MRLRLALTPLFYYQELCLRRVWVLAFSQNIDEDKTQNKKVEQAISTVKNICKGVECAGPEGERTL